jgi:hypothetical protein
MAWEHRLGIFVFTFFGPTHTRLYLHFTSAASALLCVFMLRIPLAIPLLLFNATQPTQPPHCLWDSTSLGTNKRHGNLEEQNQVSIDDGEAT